MERISGPFLSCFVAAYSVESDEGYLGFAKLCTEQPDDVWECKALRKVSVGPCSTPEAAIEEAERKARVYLAYLRQHRLV